MREVRGRRNLTSELAAESVDQQEKEAVAELGWVPPRPSQEPPVMPDELTDLTDSELMKLMTAVNKWANHLGYQLSRAQVAEKFAAQLVEKLSAFQQIKNKGGSVTAMKASVWDDEHYADARQKEHDAYAHRKLVEALYNAVDRDSFVLSRELTRRIGRNDRDRRQNRHDERGSR